LEPSGALDSVLDVSGDTTQLITFLDVDEDGRIDYLIQLLNPSTNLPELKMIYNNYDSDSFFIKAMMLNSDQSGQIYGDTSYGTTFRFVVTDVIDEKYVMVGTQNH